MQEQQAGENTPFITPDFSEVADQVGEGKYNVRITGHKLEERSEKETNRKIPVLVWTFETYGEEESKNNGRKIFLRTDVIGKGAFRLKNLFKAAMNEDLSGQFDPTMLYGREMEIVYGPQKNNPEYSEVKSMKPLQTN